MLSLTTGTAFIMWLGEQITERGIGNGMSLIIFAGIVVGLPRGIGELYEKARNRCLGRVHVPAIVILLVMMVAVVRSSSGGARRAPDSGAVRQARGRPPMMGGQSRTCR